MLSKLWSHVITHLYSAADNYQWSDIQSRDNYMFRLTWVIIRLKWITLNSIQCSKQYLHSTL